MNFNDREPVYVQIANDIKAQIAFGRLCPGQQLPSIKDQAAKLRVNPNTVARVYAVLEQEGILAKQKGLGTFVSADPALASTLQSTIAAQSLSRFVNEMLGLGYASDEIVEQLKRYFALK